MTEEEFIAETRKWCDAVIAESLSRANTVIKSLFEKFNEKNAEIERLTAKIRVEVAKFTRQKERAEKAEAEVERLREVQRWIPVTDRKPTEKDADGHGFIIAHSTILGRSTSCVWHHILNDNYTTHWKPMLEAPEKEGKL